MTDTLRRHLRRWAWRLAVRLAVVYGGVLLLLLLYLLRDRPPAALAAVAAGVVVLLVAAVAAGVRLGTRTATVLVASPRSAVLPVLQKANRGATDTVEDGLLVHSGRWTRPPVHLRSTGEGVLLTSTRAHTRRLRRLL